MSTAPAHTSPELDSAVAKIRSGRPLSARERAAVDARGLELAALRDEPGGRGQEHAPVDPEEERHLLESLVEADADVREGHRGTPWRDLFPARFATG